MGTSLDTWEYQDQNIAAVFISTDKKVNTFSSIRDHSIPEMFIKCTHPATKKSTNVARTRCLLL